MTLDAECAFDALFRAEILEEDRKWKYERATGSYKASFFIFNTKYIREFQVEIKNGIHTVRESAVSKVVSFLNRDFSVIKNRCKI